MKPSIQHLKLVLTLSLFGSLGLAIANDDKVEFRDLPAKVFKAFVLLKGDADFEEVESEKENGVQQYEAEWETDSREHSATVDSQGTLLEREHSVSEDEIPAAVAKAIAKHLPKGGKREIELQMRVSYEATVEIDGEEFEIAVNPDGTIIESDDDEDD